MSEIVCKKCEHCLEDEGNYDEWTYCPWCGDILIKSKWGED